MMKKICLIVFTVLFAAVCIFNIVRPNKPTVSERENRTLASLPSFSASSFADGSFFSGVDRCFSDTFLGRESLINISQKIRNLYSLRSILPENEEDVVFMPTDRPHIDDAEESVTELPDEEPPEEVIPDENPPEAPEQTSSEPFAEPEQTEEPEILPEEATPEKIPEAPEQTSSEPFAEPEQTETPETLPEEEKTPEKKQEEPAPVIPEVPVVTPLPTETVSAEPVTDETAEFLTDGYLIYKDAFYSIPYLVKSQDEKYGKTIAKYAELFPDARVSIVVAPLSSAMIDNEKVRKKITDQKSMIETIYSYCPDNINKVYVFPELYEHRSEYIYYRSDHHWTARGAYYAYAAFSRSIGIEPTPIDGMKEVLLNDKWRGTAYSMSNDDRVKAFTDEVYAYLPTKENSMTVYPNGEEPYTRDNCIRTSYKGYSAFICGDNPYTVIKVPENPKNMTCLVLKDSYGCAFVPYLTEIYSTIIVADPRYVNFNLYELLKDYPLTDIIFMTNIYNPSVSSWVKNVNRIIGQ